jgi:filamentous hemagglutinin family protein
VEAIIRCEWSNAMILFKRYLLSASAILSVLSIASGAAQAGALPSGGHYVSGKGEIDKVGQSLTVKQSSTTGIIDWNKFSIGSKNAVSFDNGSGATLNRVSGGNLSTIAGSLHATGSLYLMNSNGVIVSGTGRVVTGGNFAASTGSLSNSAFNDGDRRFGIGRGTVANRGSITADGTATLAGRNVSESGTIHGAQIDLDARRDLAVAGSITAAETNGAGGSVTARAHTIVIGTDGAINASASPAGQKGGTIRLVARGSTTVAGELEAQGGVNGTGSSIETSGE